MVILFWSDGFLEISVGDSGILHLANTQGRAYCVVWLMMNFECFHFVIPLLITTCYLWQTCHSIFPFLFICKYKHTFIWELRPALVMFGIQNFSNFADLKYNWIWFQHWSRFVILLHPSANFELVLVILLLNSLFLGISIHIYFFSLAKFSIIQIMWRIASLVSQFAGFFM